MASQPGPFLSPRFARRAEPGRTLQENPSLVVEWYWGDPHDVRIVGIVATPAEKNRTLDVASALADSFEALYQSFGGRVLNLAYRMTGNAESARDLAQDVWLKVFENMDTFEARSDVYTWIHRITVNHTLNHLKRERRVSWRRFLDRSVGEALRDEPAPEPEHASAPAVDHTMEMDERSRRVWEAIQGLNPKYRVPLVLHHYEEMSYREIADTMELSMAAVESRIHRARAQLIEALRPLLDDL